MSIENQNKLSTEAISTPINATTKREMTDKKNKEVQKKEDLNIYPLSNPYDTRPGEEPYKLELAWVNVIAFIYLHSAFVYALNLENSSRLSKWIIFLYGYFGSFGITAGAHRLWSHRSFKANRKLTALLVIMQTTAFQNCVIEWVRDHRVHHKYSDTNADPHNATRGFFFSHMGWLMCKKHPDVRRFGTKIDMSDLTSDWILRFQQKYYLILMPLFAFIIPTWIHTLLGETVWVAFHFQIIRYVMSLHITWSINSFAHFYGNKPYEKDILPTDSYIVGTLALGEGWHNYHHVYPWDYKVAELPHYWCNLTIAFIDFFSWIGWATELKTVSNDLIRKRLLRTGDGTHPHSSDVEILKKLSLVDADKNDENNNTNIYDWGDNDLMQNDEEVVKICGSSRISYRGYKQISAQ